MLVLPIPFFFECIRTYVYTWWWRNDSCSGLDSIEHGHILCVCVCPVQLEAMARSLPPRALCIQMPTTARIALDRHSCLIFFHFLFSRAKNIILPFWGSIYFGSISYEDLVGQLATSANQQRLGIDFKCVGGETHSSKTSKENRDDEEKYVAIHLEKKKKGHLMATNWLGSCQLLVRCSV